MSVLTGLCGLTSRSKLFCGVVSFDSLIAIRWLLNSSSASSVLCTSPVEYTCRWNLLYLSHACLPVDISSFRFVPWLRLGTCTESLWCWIVDVVALRANPDHASITLLPGRLVLLILANSPTQHGTPVQSKPLARQRDPRRAVATHTHT